MNGVEYVAAWVAGSVAYGTVALYLARRAFGLMRAARIDYQIKTKPMSTVSPVDWFNKFDRVPFLMVSMLCGLAWPWALAVVILIKTFAGVTRRVVRFLEATPTKSEFEKEQEKTDAADS